MSGQEKSLTGKVVGQLLSRLPRHVKLKYLERGHILKSGHFAAEVLPYPAVASEHFQVDALVQVLDPRIWKCKQPTRPTAFYRQAANDGASVK